MMTEKDVFHYWSLEHSCTSIVAIVLSYHVIVRLWPRVVYFAEWFKRVPHASVEIK